MKTFTYKDYIKCIHTLRLNAVFKLAEESSKYSLDSTDVEDKKIIKNILKHKKQMAKFINIFLDLNETIDSKNLMEYNNEYISTKYKLDKNKLMYKYKNKEIIFIVDEIFEFDNIILYEIINYCIGIMQEWNLTNKIRGENKYPVIVPILIYTGNKKINNIGKNNSGKISDYIFKNYDINLNYNLIDINKININYLKNKNSLLSNGIIIEKSKDKKELQNNVEKLIEGIKDRTEYKEVKRLLNYIPLNYFNNIKTLLKKIENKKGSILKKEREKKRI